MLAEATFNLFIRCAGFSEMQFYFTILVRSTTLR